MERQGDSYMEIELLMGIDIGTSSCKIAIFDLSGHLVASETEFYDTYYPSEGWAEQDPNQWWQAVTQAIKNLGKKNNNILTRVKGVGVDGQSWSSIPIDADGNVLYSTPIWFDTRASAICEEYKDKIGEEKIFNVSGNSFEPTYTLPKVIWLKREFPDIYKKTYKFLQSNSFIAYKLTGVVSQDISQCYGLHFFDMKSGQYDESIATLFDVDVEKFPEVFACHDVIGSVTEQVAIELGLNEGTPVVAGGLDAACGALGVGVLYEGETQEQGGQAGGMSVCLSEYKADPRLILSYHVVPNRYLLQGGTVGGAGVAKWFLNEFGEAEKNASKLNGTNPYYEMDLIAEHIAPGSEGLIFLPYMSGERSPLWNPKAKGVYYGIDFSKTRAHFIRANEEGAAFALKHNLDIVESLGINILELRAMGGAANSLLWTQIKADVTQKKIVVPSSDTATTLGAAILAGVGVGVYESFEEAVEKLVMIKRQHAPNKDVKELYQHQYGMYLDIYKQLEQLMNNN